MGGIPNPCGDCIGASAGAVMWEQVIDGLTDVALYDPIGHGTFSYAGGVLSRTDHDTVAAVRIAAGLAFSGPVIIEAEVAMNNGATGENWFVGLGFGSQMTADEGDGSYFTDHAAAWIGNSGGVYSISGGGYSGGASSKWRSTGLAGKPIANPGFDTYVKLRLVSFGDSIDVYYLGALIGRIATYGPPEALMFVASNLARWRNIKAWQATAAWKNLPA